MKDTIITAKRKKIELLTWLVCFVIACLLNLYAIITYDSSMIEMLTSGLYVLAFSVLLYVVWSLVRLIVYGLLRLLKH